jgi:molecular chaperone GrpE (heat shock protein)
MAAKKAKQAAAGAGNGVGKEVLELAKSVAAIHHAVEEVAEDNIALMQTVRRTADSQDALRALLLQEIGQLRSDLTGELAANALRNCCRELSPVLNALEGMLAGGDFSGAATTRQHVESLAMTMSAAFSRLGIERIVIVPGTDLFDSRIHDCVRVCSSSDSPIPAAPSRTIVRVIEAGYMVRGRLAMPAKVWVQNLEGDNVEKEGSV